MKKKRRPDLSRVAEVVLVLLLILGIIITATGIAQKTPEILRTPLSAQWEDAGSAAQGETVVRTIEADERIYTEKEDETLEASEGEQTQRIAFHPTCTANTKPSNLISYTQINVNGNTLSDESSYSPWYNMNFGPGEEYTSVDGIVTFRGNSFRSDPTYGTASISKNKIKDLWTVQTGTLSGADGAYWSGSGWMIWDFLLRI